MTSFLKMEDSSETGEEQTSCALSFSGDCVPDAVLKFAICLQI